MSKHAYVFPGQGSQFPGMGKTLFDSSDEAKNLFELANNTLGFKISDIMFNGTEEDLKQTKVTQPAIFVHSVIAFIVYCEVKPEMVAGHSLGEFSALVANGVLSFEDGLRLVSTRANAMQKACEINPSTMAAVLGLDDAKVEEVCRQVQSETGEVIVPANYNCPGQLVISGSKNAIDIACQRMKEAGAKRALVLPVSGAFHSELMSPAKEDLAAEIDKTIFNIPVCPVYQNVNASPVSDPMQIKENLIQQLTQPVRWTQTIQRMIQDGAHHFTESGPGKVLQGLILKIDKTVKTDSIQ